MLDQGGMQVQDAIAMCIGVAVELMQSRHAKRVWFKPRCFEQLMIAIVFEIIGIGLAAAAATVALVLEDTTPADADGSLASLIPIFTGRFCTAV